MNEVKQKILEWFSESERPLTERFYSGADLNGLCALVEWLNKINKKVEKLVPSVNTLSQKTYETKADVIIYIGPTSQWTRVRPVSTVYCIVVYTDYTRELDYFTFPYDNTKCNFYHIRLENENIKDICSAFPEILKKYNIFPDNRYICGNITIKNANGKYLYFDIDKCKSVKAWSQVVIAECKKCKKNIFKCNETRKICNKHKLDASKCSETCKTTEKLVCSVTNENLPLTLNIFAHHTQHCELNEERVYFCPDSECNKECKSPTELSKHMNKQMIKRNGNHYLQGEDVMLKCFLSDRGMIFLTTTTEVMGLPSINVTSKMVYDLIPREKMAFVLHISYLQSVAIRKDELNVLLAAPAKIGAKVCRNPISVSKSVAMIGWPLTRISARYDCGTFENACDNNEFIVKTGTYNYTYKTTYSKYAFPRSNAVELFAKTEYLKHILTYTYFFTPLQKHKRFGNRAYMHNDRLYINLYMWLLDDDKSELIFETIKSIGNLPSVGDLDKDEEKLINGVLTDLPGWARCDFLRKRLLKTSVKKTRVRYLSDEHHKFDTGYVYETVQQLVDNNYKDYTLDFGRFVKDTYKNETTQGMFNEMKEKREIIVHENELEMLSTPFVMWELNRHRMIFPGLDFKPPTKELIEGEKNVNQVFIAPWFCTLVSGFYEIYDTLSTSEKLELRFIYERNIFGNEVISLNRSTRLKFVALRLCDYDLTLFCTKNETQDRFKWMTEKQKIPIQFEEHAAYEAEWKASLEKLEREGETYKKTPLACHRPHKLQEHIRKAFERKIGSVDFLKSRYKSWRLREVIKDVCKSARDIQFNLDDFLHFVTIDDYRKWIVSYNQEVVLGPPDRHPEINLMEKSSSTMENLKKIPFSKHLTQRQNCMSDQDMLKRTMLRSDSKGMMKLINNGIIPCTDVINAAKLNHQMYTCQIILGYMYDI
jgi:hypothetical protein